MICHYLLKQFKLFIIYRLLWLPYPESCLKQDLKTEQILSTASFLPFKPSNLPYSHQLEPYLCMKIDKIILSSLSFVSGIYFLKFNLVNSQIRFYHFFCLFGLVVFVFGFFFVTAKETFVLVQFTVR